MYTNGHIIVIPMPPIITAAPYSDQLLSNIRCC